MRKSPPWRACWGRGIRKKSCGNVLLRLVLHRAISRENRRRGGRAGAAGLGKKAVETPQQGCGLSCTGTPSPHLAEGVRLLVEVVELHAVPRGLVCVCVLCVCVSVCVCVCPCEGVWARAGACVRACVPTSVGHSLSPPPLSLYLPPSRPPARPLSRPPSRTLSPLSLAPSLSPTLPVSTSPSHLLAPCLPHSLSLSPSLSPCTRARGCGRRRLVGKKVRDLVEVIIIIIK